MNSGGNQYRGWPAIPGTGFGSSKINSNKVFRAFCLIVWILFWSYLVQGVQKAVQNRIFFDRFEANQSLGREIRILKIGADASR